jgi:hypothetical protein
MQKSSPERIQIKLFPFRFAKRKKGNDVTGVNRIPAANCRLSSLKGQYPEMFFSTIPSYVS